MEPHNVSHAGSGLDEFVGRETEIRSITAFLQETIAGAGRIVLIEGEAGIGKTRLAAEAAGKPDLTGRRVDS